MDTCVKMLAKYFSISASQSLIGDAGNELCSHITDYPLLLSVKGLANLERKTHFWLLLDAKCPLCAHRKCGECREVSFSILACCQCRARAIARLSTIQKLLNDEKNQ